MKKFRILIMLLSICFGSLNLININATDSNYTKPKNEIPLSIGSEVINFGTIDFNNLSEGNNIVNIIIHDDKVNNVRIGLQIEINDSNQLVSPLSSFEGNWSGGTLPIGKTVRLTPWIQSLFPAGNISFGVDGTYLKNNVIASLSNISTGQCQQSLYVCTISSIEIGRENATSTFPAFASMEFERTLLQFGTTTSGFLTLELNYSGQTRVSWFY